jgi:formamidopyrimidine-DNA glycosylase
VPELPDVEGFRRYFVRHAMRQRIEAVDVPAPDILRNTTPQALGRGLHGHRFTRTERLGKWFLAYTDDSAVLLIHFGMTGGLEWSTEKGSDHPHDRVILRLEKGKLHYRNMRKLGGVWLARGAEETAAITGRLGPDALGLDRECFEEILSGRRGRVKPTLMNQRLLAGIGNELADEILWQARVHPARPVSELEKRERSAIYRAMGKVLEESIRHGRIPRHPSWLSAARGTTDTPCPRCGTTFERSRIGGRTSYWCPRCQAASRDRS